MRSDFSADSSENNFCDMKEYSKRCRQRGMADPVPLSRFTPRVGGVFSFGSLSREYY
jgi:hypothetical protein